MDIEGYDFDALARLAVDDPEEFERVRERAIRAAIDDAPQPARKRLEGLQWQIDVERSQSETPLAACSKLNQMLWEQVSGPGGLLDSLGGLNAVAGAGNEASPDEPDSPEIHPEPRPVEKMRMESNVLPFKPPAGERERPDEPGPD